MKLEKARRFRYRVEGGNEERWKRDIEREGGGCSVSASCSQS